MNNYDFTKSFIKSENISSNNTLNKMNELNRLERINDNMNGINPFTKEKMNKSSITEEKKELEFDMNKQIKAIKSIEKD